MGRVFNVGSWVTNRVCGLRLVRKVSRKRYGGKATYEYERFFVPLPMRYSDVARRWLEEDLTVSFDSYSGGFAVLAMRDGEPANEEIAGEFNAMVKYFEMMKIFPEIW